MGMKNIVHYLKQTEGFVSIETIVVAGLVIGMAGVVYGALRAQTSEVADTTLNKVQTASNSAVPRPPIPE